jgi:hypothetical protein
MVMAMLFYHTHDYMRVEDTRFTHNREQGATDRNQDLVVRVLGMKSNALGWELDRMGSLSAQRGRL